MEKTIAENLSTGSMGVDEQDKRGKTTALGCLASQDSSEELRAQFPSSMRAECCGVSSMGTTSHSQDMTKTWIMRRDHGGSIQLKVRGRLGNDARDVQEIDVLGRVIKCADWGCSWQADPRHRRLILEHFGFDEKTKVLTTNGVKEIATEAGQDETPLNPDEATQYRAVAARFNYLAADCPDLQYPTKEICREMSAPMVKSYEKLKRLARYLAGRPEVKWYYRG